MTIKNNKAPFLLTASLICADFLSLEKELKKLKKGGIDLIHFDVMDGSFVPRFGLFPEILSLIKKITDLPIDVHMMVQNPEDYIKVFADGGADYFVVHAESDQHLHRTLKRIHEYGMKAGVALNPATPLTVLDYLLDDLDLVLLMAINPGIVGHKLIPQMIDKIADLKMKLQRHPNVLIEVDGGVAFESAPEMVRRGANILVCGSSTIFKLDQKVDVKIKQFRKYTNRTLSHK